MLRKACLKGFEAAVRSVQPSEAVKKHVQVIGNEIVVGDQKYFGRIHVVGFGKAVFGMFEALREVINNDSLIDECILSVPKGLNAESDFNKVRIFEGAQNNLPDEDSLKSAEEIKNLILNIPKDRILFVLISGGGSALLPSPINPITLNEKSNLIKDLSKSGASIQELNVVRKRLSNLKGGKLAQLSKGIPTISLILSDIINDPLDLIASGPTVINEDSPDDAIKIINKFGVEIPKNIQFVLNDEDNFVEQKEEDFDHVQNVLIGNIDAAISSLAQSIKSQLPEFDVIVGSGNVSGEARKVGQIFAQMAKAFFVNDDDEIAKLFQDLNQNVTFSCSDANNLCFICGGETTVQVTGNGKGGRNQEMVLSFALEMNGEESNEYCFLSAGTDGIDGPTDAAGAVVTHEDEFDKDLMREYLMDNNSYEYFSKFGNLIKIGHTGTNVMDLQILMCKK